MPADAAADKNIERHKHRKGVLNILGYPYVNRKGNSEVWNLGHALLNATKLTNKPCSQKLPPEIGQQEVQAPGESQSSSQTPLSKPQVRPSAQVLPPAPPPMGLAHASPPARNAASSSRTRGFALSVAVLQTSFGPQSASDVQLAAGYTRPSAGYRSHRNWANNAAVHTGRLWYTFHAVITNLASAQSVSWFLGAFTKGDIGLDRYNRNHRHNQGGRCNRSVGFTRFWGLFDALIGKPLQM